MTRIVEGLKTLTSCSLVAMEKGDSLIKELNKLKR